MKIVFFETEDWEEKYLKETLKGHDVVFVEDELTEESKNFDEIKDADVVSVFIYSKVDKKILSRFEKLKAVITRSVGFDHVDLKECKKKKIKVYNIPNYGENTVAEHTFALILALSRKIPMACSRTIKSNFDLEGLTGFDLKGKTMGVVGMGSIGQHVARMAKGFQMNVVAFDVRKNIKLSKRLGFKYVKFETLLKDSDIVTLHVPYNKQTHHLINRKNIKLMKKNSLLINTARGGIVDTTAIVEALNKKEIGGAGLDVLEGEAMIKEERELISKRFSNEALQSLLENHVLMTYENVVITPHNAFNSKEALQRILDLTIDTVGCISKNKKCDNLVK